MSLLQQRLQQFRTHNSQAVTQDEAKPVAPSLILVRQARRRSCGKPRHHDVDAMEPHVRADWSK